MSKGVNKVIIIGSLGKDPEVRAMPNGNQVANITVATNESWKDKQTGQQQERTEWHRVIFFNKLAEIVGQYLQKGSKIYIEGSLRTNKWQDQAGNDQYTTEIVASNMQMLGSNAGQQQSAQQQQQQGYQNPQQTQQAPLQPQPAQQQSQPQSHGGFNDNIPF